MSHYVKLEKTDFVSSFWVRKCERGNSGMERESLLRERNGNGIQCYGSGTVAGLSLTVAGQDRDRCLRERDGRGTGKPVPCKTLA